MVLRQIKGREGDREGGGCSGATTREEGRRQQGVQQGYKREARSGHETDKGEKGKSRRGDLSRAATREGGRGLQGSGMSERGRELKGGEISREIESPKFGLVPRN